MPFDQEHVEEPVGRRTLQAGNMDEAWNFPGVEVHAVDWERIETMWCRLNDTADDEICSWDSCGRSPPSG